MEEVLQEIKVGNQTILRRLGDVLDNHTCDSECHAIKDQSEIRRLTERLSELEERDRKQRDTLDAIKKEMQAFKRSLEQLKSTSRSTNTGHLRMNPTERQILPMSDKPTPTDVRSTMGNSNNDDKGDVTTLGDTEHPSSYTNHAEIGKTSGSYNKGPRVKDTEISRCEDQPPEEASTVSKDTTTKSSGDGRTSKTHSTQNKSNDSGAKDNQPIPVKHDAKKTLIPTDTWWRICKAEEKAGSNTEVQTLDGVHTILCVDISESMVDCWTQVQKFIYDYLDGLEKLVRGNNFDEENVALVTFGHETKTHVRSTKELKRIRTAFDAITLGGPTPLFGGILMAVCTAQSNENKCIINGAEVHKRIVLISDGHLTEAELFSGPDELDLSKQDESVAYIMDIVERFPQSGKELISVPVGKANLELHEQLEAVACGKRYSYKEGAKFARRFYLTKRSPIGIKSLGEDEGLGGLFRFSRSLMSGIDLSGLDLMEESGIPGLSGLTDLLRNQESALKGLMEMDPSTTTDTADLTEEDQEHIKEIAEDHKRLVVESIKRSNSNTDRQYRERNSSTLPRIGSRVRRGPDWTWKNQDGGGPGTVIGHEKHEGDQVWVDWDANGDTNVYHYGGSGMYDVLLVDETRTIGKTENIAVGCIVQPGDNWKFDFRRVKRHEEGVVIRKHRFNKVEVKWERGFRGDYSYSPKGPSELKLSPKSIRHQTHNSAIIGE